MKRGPGVPWLRQASDSVLLDLLVQPRASRTRITGEHGDRLKIQIAAPPVEGEANAALIEHIAARLSLPKRDVVIAHGSTGKRKTLSIHGLDLETIHTRLTSKEG